MPLWNQGHRDKLHLQNCSVGRIGIIFSAVIRKTCSFFSSHIAGFDTSLTRLKLCHHPSTVFDRLVTRQCCSTLSWARQKLCVCSKVWLTKDRQLLTLLSKHSLQQHSCIIAICTGKMMCFRNALNWSLSTSKLCTEHSQGKGAHLTEWVTKQTSPDPQPAPSTSKRRPVLWDAGRSLVAGRVPVGPVGNA